MTDIQPTIADEVERYLRTGEADPHLAAWSGAFVERANRAHEDLRGALVREVWRLADGLSHKRLPQADGVALTRGKVEPMVRGLFPRAEQDLVLATLEKSVVFLTSANIEPLLLGHSFDSSAWTLALVAEATGVGNGWKVILSRCVPPSRPRTASVNRTPRTSHRHHRCAHRTADLGAALEASIRNRHHPLPALRRNAAGQSQADCEAIS